MIITIGLGILASLFIVMAFLLDDQHSVIKISSLSLAILIMALLSSHLNVLTNNYYCDIVLKNETVTQGGNFTSYAYTRECYPYSKNTAFSTFKLLNYFVRYLPWYAFVFILYYGAKALGLDLLEKVKELFKKNE